MTKSSPEHVADFLLEFLPNLLPKPVDSAVKSIIGVFREQLDGLLKQPRLRRELLEAAQNAESDFRTKAMEQLRNDELTQAIASFPQFDRDLFQAALQSLPEHLNEEYLATHLRTYISNDWSGKFTSAELREGVAIYLNCLRLQLLKVDGFADVVVRLATLRTDQNVEHIQASVDELKQLIKLLVNQGAFSQLTAYSLFTIPPPVADFTGRETELAQLKASFENGAIITGVSGAGGVGKTELARKLAYEIAGHFPDAQMNIDLLGTFEKPTSPEDVMHRLLEPFYVGQKLPDDKTQLKGLYQQTFANKKVLLLLDNVANAAQVRPLIPPAPSAAIITSRQHFSLTEFGMREPLRLDVLSPDKAREFLCGASPNLNYSLNEDVSQLATLCGHMPLALRVAASLLNDRSDWTVNTLLKRLSDEQTRLGHLQRNNDLDLNVEATLALSYDLLDHTFKKKFRQLGVFTAPFVAASAQAVWDLQNEDEADNFLGNLTNRSLVKLLPTPFGKQEGGDVYAYSLHNLTRLFALKELVKDKEETEQTVIRHAYHFLEWASAAEEMYKEGHENVLLGLAQIRFIWTELNFAFENLQPNGKRFPRPQNADIWLSKFPASFIYLVDILLPPREKIRLLQISLTAAQNIKNQHLEGFLTASLGTAYRQIGDIEKSIIFLEQSLIIARKNKDESVIGMALANLANAYTDVGNFNLAMDMYNERISLAQKYNDRRAEGISIGNKGNVYLKTGDARKAIECFKKQLEIFREIGEMRGESGSLSSLGNAYSDLGELRLSLQCQLSALKIIQKINDPRFEGMILGNIGSIYFSLDNYDESARYYNKALIISRDVGDKRNEGNWTGGIGLAYKNQGKFQEAITLFEKAMLIHRKVNDYQGEIRDLGNLGNVYMEIGNIQKAYEFYQQGKNIAKEHRDRRSEGDALINLGLLHKKLGEKKKAKAYFLEALEILRSIGSPYILNIKEWLTELDV